MVDQQLKKHIKSHKGEIIMTPKTMKKMKNAVAWFEIPAMEISRAKKFYESILNLEMIDMDLDDF